MSEREATSIFLFAMNSVGSVPSAISRYVYPIFLSCFLLGAYSSTVFSACALSTSHPTRNIRTQGSRHLGRGAALRRASVTYDKCLSDQYGGVPLFDRSYLKYSNRSTLPPVLYSSRWEREFTKTMDSTQRLTEAFYHHGSVIEIQRLKEYDKIYEYFMAEYGTGLKMSAPTYWKRDLKTDPRLSENQRWNSDSVFAQERLMGLNPLQLQRVTYSNKVGLSWARLGKLLNKSFNWERALQTAVGRKISIKKTIASHRLYVLHFPLLSKVSADPRSVSPYRGKTLMDPLALFVATDNETAPLVPVAIQLGTTGNCPRVVARADESSSPEDFAWWTIAKMYVNSADALVSQILHHLVNGHLVSEAFVVSTVRHLNPRHPLHVLLSPHFEGLIGINTKGFQLLTSENGTITNLAAFGHKGLLQLIKLAYNEWDFRKADFLVDLQMRGVSNSRTLPYYPYRDDGRLVYDVIRRYIRRYVDHSYCQDQEVASDQELLMWSLEINEAHKGHGFPRYITNKAQLIDVLTRIVWINSVHHAAVNYPIKEFGSYTLVVAFALFKKPSDWTADEIANISRENTGSLRLMLPPFKMAVLQASTASQLAALRFKGLLDYVDDMEGALQNLTRLYRRKLIGDQKNSVQSFINRRNTERKKRNLLAYRYMQPTELTNSISI